MLKRELESQTADQTASEQAVADARDEAAKVSAKAGEAKEPKSQVRRQ